MVKVSIVGISGYSGVELFHILNNHPEACIVAVTSGSHNGQKLSEIFPHLANVDLVCNDYSPDEVAKLSDVIFTCVPHGGPAMDYAASAKKFSKKMIDLSADFRLKDKNIYEKWYKVTHKYPELLSEAVYGLPELHREEIKKAWLIGNPGCYTTAAILALSPLLKNDLIDEKTIIVDAKSGVSGAGRKMKQEYHFTELNEGLSAYGFATHRHTPEIEQEISLVSKTNIVISFSPNLVPMVRGILSSSYAKLKIKIDYAEVLSMFKSMYKDEPFVRIMENGMPNTKFVAGTNYIDIAVKIDERTNTIAVFTAIDNLIKGASGQAVHNFNLMFGFDEKTGLNLKPNFP
jgi:N-acetyl-gamma-glutamyl-phosphate reductase